MDRINSTNDSLSKSKVSHADLTRYIQKNTGKILNLLDGVEQELESRKRLGKHVRFNKTVDFEPEAPTNITYETGDQKGRMSEYDYPDDGFGGVYGSESVSNPSFDLENKFNQFIENYSQIGTTQFQDDNREIPRNSKTYWGEQWPNVYLSSSHPEVKWHKGRPDLIPQFAASIGYTKTGTPLYACRTWDEGRSYLIPAFVDYYEGKCFFGKDEKLMSSTTYEVMECNCLAWDDAKGTPVFDLPRYAYQAGYNEDNEPLYFGRAFIDGAITPGYVEQRDVKGAPNNRAYALIIPFRGNLLRIFDSYEIMVVITSV